eukprot:TRINITY_DN16502_c0_g1_i1.p1 TRINITY_DN16502_c0_g1~~TRINITY_DN16502_c0_g1_i1.p1  ORF type:complete len:300 (+),score=48.25 TRINITY_DN16502_c0_g1_i1:79-978(+)
MRRRNAPSAHSVAIVDISGDEKQPLLTTSTNSTREASNQKTFFDMFYLRIFEILKDLLCFSYLWYPNEDVSTTEALEEFKRFISPPYDSNNRQHELLLSRLWDLSFPDQHLSTRKTIQWQNLGFQGTDPASDFRGVGLFGLKNLIYFAENYPFKYRAMLQGRPPMEGYPFAISGLNITMMLFELLGIGLKSKLKGERSYYYSRRNMCRIIFHKQLEGSTGGYQSHVSEQSEAKSSIYFAYSELYCLSFMSLDDEWYRSKATYMDFPRVLERVTKEVEELISTFNGGADVQNYTRNRFAV